ncbi:sugar-binding protein [Salinithrix halophila]|uniref:Sugar-binding protein n=1 Tax=Salinithrix halophila TaxID=1485204 RepID=A0ABV8JF09_9BACL
MVRRGLLVLTVTMLAVSLGFAVYFSQEAIQADKPQDRKPIHHHPEFHLVFISQEMGSLYWKEVEKGARAAAADHDVVIEFEAPARPNIEEHVGLIERAVASQVDGIITQGLTDQDFTPVINKAVDRGIQVLTVDSDIKGSKRYAYVGTDNYRAGYLAGEKMAEAMGGEGDVGIVTSSEKVNNMKQRIEGFKDAVRQHSKIRIVAVEETHLLKKTSQKAGEIFNAHPDVKGFFGTSASDASGLVEVADERGKIGEVVIMAFDDLPQTLRYLEEGKLEVVVVQQPYEMGYRSVTSMLALLKGKQPNRDMHTSVRLQTSDDLRKKEETP